MLFFYLIALFNWFKRFFKGSDSIHPQTVDLLQIARDEHDQVLREINAIQREYSILRKTEHTKEPKTFEKRKSKVYKAQPFDFSGLRTDDSDDIDVIYGKNRRKLKF